MSIKMYLTDTDYKVLQFVEEQGSITISECQKIFYNTQKYGYDIARKRLMKMVNYNKLKVGKDENTNQNVYYMDKKMRYHNLLTLDYYAELIRSGADIIYFKQEQPWLNNKRFSDAYCCYILGDKVFFNVVEIVRTNGIDKDKYEEIYKSKEAHMLNNNIYKQLGGTEINSFPRLIVIDNVVHKQDYYINDDIEIIQLDFNLNNFSKIFV